MKTRGFEFACYIPVTAISFAINNTTTILACVILFASALGGRANQTVVTLQTGLNWVGCNVNGPGGNDINNTAFLQIPDSLSDPNGPGPGSTCAQLYVWHSYGEYGGFITYYYCGVSNGIPYDWWPPLSGWVDDGGNPVSGVIWNPGEGMFIYIFNPPTAITFNGTPATPVFPPTNYSGCNAWSLLCSQTTNATSTYADVTGFAPQEGSQVSFTFPTNLVFLATDTYTNGAWTPGIPTLTNSAPAFFLVPCTPISSLLLHTTLSSGQVTVQWSDSGVLQESTDLNTWTDLSGATSPYITAPTSAQMFYRVRQ
jgi:hypothetical protein